MPYGSRRTPIGKRRERVVVYGRPTTDDGMGGQTASTPPTRIAGIWVRPIPLDDRRLEMVGGGQLTATQTYHFDTRYRTDLRPSMYFVRRGRNLEISSVTDDDAGKRRLILFCTEVQG